MLSVLLAISRLIRSDFVHSLLVTCSGFVCLAIFAAFAISALAFVSINMTVSFGFSAFDSSILVSCLCSLLPTQSDTANRWIYAGLLSLGLAFFGFHTLAILFTQIGT